ncbi:MAG: thioredoxin family protein [Acidimicrobiia bacterium]
MEIELLCIAGCPNRSLARRHIDLALARTGRDAVVRERVVASAEEAQSLGMRGSPTILIDGRDAFAGAAAGGGLSCRLYSSEAGVSGAPTVSQLVEAMGG